MANIIYSDTTKQTARYAKALGHPARLAILKYLYDNECSYIKDLIKEIPMAQSTISQHIKELKDAGLIEGINELPKIKYCINDSNWSRAKQLLQALLNEEFSSINCF